MAYTTSSAYKNAVKQSGRRKTVVDLYYNKQNVPVIEDLPVISGSITIDMNSPTRRTGTLTLDSPELITRDPTASLLPYGLEVGIRMGVVFPNGTSELIPVGRFHIQDITWDDDGGSIPTISIFDRSFAVGEESSRNAIYDYSNKTTTFAINDLIGGSYAPFTSDGLMTSKVNPLAQLPGHVVVVTDAFVRSHDIKIPSGNPIQGGTYWDAVTQYATAIGAEVFFDADAVNVILRQVPNITSMVGDSDIVATVAAGSYGTLVTANRLISRAGAYNAVEMTGTLPANSTSTAAPPYVFVFDNNPSSPTYYFGPFGKVVYSFSSDTITKRADLLVAANAKLARLVGFSESATISMLPDPSLDAGDFIKITFLDGSSEYHMIQTIGLDLAGGAMSITTIAPNSL